MTEGHLAVRANRFDVGRGHCAVALFRGWIRSRWGRHDCDGDGDGCFYPSPRTSLGQGKQLLTTATWMAAKESGPWKLRECM